MRNPKTNQATSTTSQGMHPKTSPTERPRRTPVSLRPSVLGLRHGLRFRKRKTRTPPSEFNLSLPANQDGLSSQLIRSSSETFPLKAKLVLRRLNSIDYTEVSTSATCSSSNLFTTTAT